MHAAGLSVKFTNGALSIVAGASSLRLRLREHSLSLDFRCVNFLELLLRFSDELTCVLARIREQFFYLFVGFIPEHFCSAMSGDQDFTNGLLDGRRFASGLVGQHPPRFVESHSQV
jgi:hypothetical protein